MAKGLTMANELTVASGRAPRWAAKRPNPQKSDTQFSTHLPNIPALPTLHAHGKKLHSKKLKTHP